ncbi:hypothetical protein CP49_27695 [Bradyrhizobium valentinum]|uniref:Uncharacterized protein n=1 Tax=Bradyrhizobium valentinum TaxID=1518501 RepID=A0A0R3KV29_9BRAD|nr:hypothetical protein CP49_27695 [Bradyrhizobium valentinum]
MGAGACSWCSIGKRPLQSLLCDLPANRLARIDVEPIVDAGPYARLSRFFPVSQQPAAVVGENAGQHGRGRG